MKTEEIKSPVSQASYFPEPFKEKETQALDQQFSASSKESAEIEIFTKEGDKVTLSFNSSSQTQYEAMRQMTYDSSGSLGYKENRQYAFDSKNELFISVEGDLNDTEKKEIQKAIQTMKHIMNGFFNDNSLNIGNLSENFGKWESLSGLEASFSYERSLSLIEKYEKNSTFSDESAIKSASDKKDSDRLPKPQTVDQLIKDLVRQVESTTVPPTRFDEPLDRLFEEFSKRIGNSLYDDDRNRAIDLLSKIRTQLDETRNILTKSLAADLEED